MRMTPGIANFRAAAQLPSFGGGGLASDLPPRQSARMVVELLEQATAAVNLAVP